MAIERLWQAVANPTKDLQRIAVQRAQDSTKPYGADLPRGGAGNGLLTPLIGGDERFAGAFIDAAGVAPVSDVAEHFVNSLHGGLELADRLQVLGFVLGLPNIGTLNH